MKKLFNKNNLINVLLILYVLSIVLDLHIFYNSVSTLIRIFVITSFFVIILFKYGNKKDIKNLLLYSFIYLIYIILHLFNIDNNLIFSEILYFIKMIMSLFIIYIVCKLNIGLDKFIKYIKICLFLICGSIVICNVFKIGYNSYSFDRLKYSIFYWGDNNLLYTDVSSKGYFHLGNQIVAIILLYLPLLLIEIKNKLNVKNVLLLFTVLLSTLMLGTRLSCIVPLIILYISLFIFILLMLINREKKNYKLLLFIIGIISIYSIGLLYSPINKKNDYYNDLVIEYEQVPNEDSVIKNEIENNEDINREKEFNSIVNENFYLRYYPYDNDKEFWDKLFLEDDSLLVNSRYVEKRIIKRVIELNNNKYDKWVGIGYNKIINIQNIEQDYVMQYYSLGIIGSILVLGIYIIMYLLLVFRFGINLDNKFNFNNIMLLLGVGIVLVSAYFSGNLLNSISIIIPLSFVIGVAFNEMKKKNNKKDYEYILGFKTCTLSKEEIIKRLDNDLKNKKKNIIYNSNPLIICNFYKDINIVKEFNEQDYNIPDGIGVVYASKMKNGYIKNRIPGIEMVESICEISVLNKKKIFLYGSKPGVAIKAKEELEKKYKGINICGTCDGYGKEDDALKNILKAKPDILFVALGSPKQELFIINNKNKLKDIGIIMPVGGSLDVISGNLSRAPKFVCKIHMEWLYRMVKEPKRFKQLFTLIKFVFLVIFRNGWYNKRWSDLVDDKVN